mmetsp:Transcript_39678/g.119208  ORF Transcript_39678/g.119208 Transcript_39678/m.119208 type:complete len:212 (+) Transcript_39678:556-1191(+)
MTTTSFGMLLSGEIKARTDHIKDLNSIPVQHGTKASLPPLFVRRTFLSFLNHFVNRRRVICIPEGVHRKLTRHAGRQIERVVDPSRQFPVVDRSRGEEGRSGSGSGSIVIVIVRPFSSSGTARRKCAHHRDVGLALDAAGPSEGRAHGLEEGRLRPVQGGGDVVGSDLQAEIGNAPDGILDRLPEGLIALDLRIQRESNAGEALCRRRCGE